MGATSQRVQEEEEPVPSAPTTPTSPHDDEDDRQQPHTVLLSWRILLVGAEDDEIRCWSTPIPKDHSIHHLQHDQGISISMVLFSSACSPS